MSCDDIIHKGKFKARGNGNPYEVEWEIRGSKNEPLDNGEFIGMHATGRIINMGTGARSEYNTRKDALGDETNFDQLGGNFGILLTSNDRDACQEFLDFLNNQSPQFKSLNLSVIS